MKSLNEQALESLRSAMRADPDNLDAFLIYADQLQERGDPRGELISLQLALRSHRAQADESAESAARDRALNAALDALVRERWSSLTGGLSTAHCSVDWRLGFVQRVTISVEDVGSVGQVQSSLRTFLQSEACLFMRTLQIYIINGNDDPWHQPILDAIADAHLPDSLRMFGLYCGDDDDYPRLWEGSLGQIAALWPALSTATHVELCGDPTDEPLALPDAAHMPALTRLALRSWSRPSEMCKRLVASGLLDQLDLLDVSEDSLDEDGGRVLLDHRTAGNRLPRLDVSPDELPIEIALELCRDDQSDMYWPCSIVLLDARGCALVADGILEVVLEIDLTTGDRTVVSGSDRGEGPALEEPASLALDEANHRVLVVDESLGALLAIDLATGDRVVISDARRGSGPVLKKSTSVKLDAAASRALIVDQELSALLAIDLATGDRTVISGPRIGRGPALKSPSSLTLDAANHRALVVDWSTETLMAIDLSTGDRTAISNEDVGGGPELTFPESVTLDTANHRVLVADDISEAILAIDLNTGDRTYVSNRRIGAGRCLKSPYSLALDAANHRVLVGDTELERLIAVDLATGDRTMISGAGVSKIASSTPEQE